MREWHMLSLNFKHATQLKFIDKWNWNFLCISLLAVFWIIHHRERRRKVCWFWNFLFTTEVESTENHWKKNFFFLFYFIFFFFVVDQQRKSCFFSLLPWSLQSSDKRFESKNSFLTKKCLFRKVYDRRCDVSTNMALSPIPKEAQQA
jgi:hypothetical protein